MSARNPTGLIILEEATSPEPSILPIHICYIALPIPPKLPLPVRIWTPI